jgi:molybdopterin molybdotransferase
MRTVEEALRAVGDAVAGVRTRTETVALEEALGRFLAQDVAMDHDVPPFDRATMDGFAVRAADAVAPGAVLRVVGRVRAGERPDRPVAPGEAVAIMTGAPMPWGADAVVPVEDVDPTAGVAGAEEAVRVRVAVLKGSAIARRGEQVAAAETVLRAGARVHPGAVGVLATAGKARVSVAARPTVAVVTTGDEVVPVSETPGPARLRDGNGPALVAQAVRAGATAVREGPVRDERGPLEAAFARGLAADVLCVSGGVSMGERDLVPAALEALGVECVFHRWAAKPGGPLWFGRRGKTLVFGLPGNPAAGFVGFEVLVVPALRALMGVPFAPRETVRARYEGVSAKASEKRLYVPVRRSTAGSAHVAVPVRWKGSGDPFGLALADGIAAIPEGVRIERAGAVEVDVIPLEGTS